MHCISHSQGRRGRSGRCCRVRPARAPCLAGTHSSTRMLARVSRPRKCLPPIARSPLALRTLPPAAAADVAVAAAPARTRPTARQAFSTRPHHAPTSPRRPPRRRRGRNPRAGTISSTLTPARASRPRKCRRSTASSSRLRLPQALLRLRHHMALRRRRESSLLWPTSLSAGRKTRGTSCKSF